MLVAGAKSGFVKGYYYNHVSEQWEQVGQKIGELSDAGTGFERVVISLG